MADPVSTAGTGRHAAISYPSPESPSHQNTVILVGRLSGELQVHELDDGVTLGRFRLVVERDRPATSKRGASIDTIDCVTWTDALRQLVEACPSGDVLRIAGSLRRRFFQTSGGARASRYDVEVVDVAKLG